VFELAGVSLNVAKLDFISPVALFLVQGSCAVGQTPRLPLVAEAADNQVRGGTGGW